VRGRSADASACLAKPLPVVIVVLAAPVFSLLFFFLTPPIFLIVEGVPVLFILFL
jgi:uncharacterized membrane protein